MRELGGPHARGGGDRGGEHPGQVLERQHVPDRRVELRHRDLVVGEQLLPVVLVGREFARCADLHRHLDVEASGQRESRRVGSVGGEAEGLELLDRLVVAERGALEAPLVAQDRLEHVRIGRVWDAVERVERGHNRRRAGVDRRLVGGQVVVEELLGRHVDRVVLTARDRGTVGAEVLDRRRHLGGRGEVVALVALDLRRGDRRTEERVLAGALDDPAPARITADVDHRIEGPLDSVSGRLRGGHRLVVLHQRRVPAGRFAERDREHRLVAVDHVESEDQRNLQPGLQRRPLDRVDVLDADEVQHRADLTILGLADQVTRRAVGPIRRRHLELAELLGDRHLRQQRADLAVDLSLGEMRGGLLVGLLTARSLSSRVLGRLLSVLSPRPVAARWTPGRRFADPSFASSGPPLRELSAPTAPPRKHH